MKCGWIMVVIVLLWLTFMVGIWEPESKNGDGKKITNNIETIVKEIEKEVVIEFLDSKDGYMELSVSLDGKTYTDWNVVRDINGRAYYKVRRKK